MSLITTNCINVYVKDDYVQRCKLDKSICNGECSNLVKKYSTENDIKYDYDKILDEWAEKIIKKADKYEEVKLQSEPCSFSYGYNKGYSDGLYMAMSMLSLIEKKEKKRVEPTPPPIRIVRGGKVIK